MSQILVAKRKVGVWKFSLLILLSLQRNRSQDHQLKGDGFGNLRTKKAGNNCLCKCGSEQTKKKEGWLGTGPSEVRNYELIGKQVCTVVHFLQLRCKVKGCGIGLNGLCDLARCICGKERGEGSCSGIRSDHEVWNLTCVSREVRTGWRWEGMKSLLGSMDGRWRINGISTWEWGKRRLEVWVEECLEGIHSQVCFI